MRLVGASFVGRDRRSVTRISRRRSTTSAGRRSPCCAAIELPPEQADEQRDRLLGGFRWILVDEYQDIGPQQYELIGALAGRSRATRTRA
jgi:ATP-dependent DNA helicase RecQ